MGPLKLSEGLGRPGLPKVRVGQALKRRLSECFFVELSLEPKLIWMQILGLAAGFLGPTQGQVLELVLVRVVVQEVCECAP